MPVFAGFARSAHRLLNPRNMSARMVWVVGMIMVGTVSAACSGTTTGSDLNGNGGAGNGGAGGGFLSSVSDNKKDGQPAQQSSPTSPTSPTGQNTPAKAPANNAAGVCGLGESTGSTACDACLDPGCCTSIQACQNNPECLAEWDCAKACGGDRTCGAQCREEHAAGDADLQAFISCFQQKCSGACQ